MIRPPPLSTLDDFIKRAEAIEEWNRPFFFFLNWSDNELFAMDEL